MRRAATSLVVLAVAGCAASLSSFQPAHVPARGHVQAEAGFDVSAPVGTIVRTIDAGKTLAQSSQSRTLSDDERHQLIEAGANVALDPPAAVAHLGIAWAPFTRTEVSLRLSSGAWRAGARYQILDQARDGWDLTAGVGVQRFAYEFPVSDVLDVVHLNDFQRWSVDIPIAFGRRGDAYRLWGGPRIVLSRYDTSLELRLPPVAGAAAQDVLASLDGNAAFVGVQGGAAVGWRHLFVGVELTVVQLLSTAHIDVAGTRYDADLGGPIVYPGLALMGEF